ncbi:transcriptional regulator [Chitinophaga parva]|uniref:Transcriptional regulator n=1 Tax=Chitinophaga parva TaxID=2169414 RepID=A0A2T7BD90_9BACT|nr:transcriptional regulator [Chitinophaga parva]
MNAFEKWLQHLQQLWQERLQRLDEVLLKLKHKKP